jgi:hypothetical protein
MEDVSGALAVKKLPRIIRFRAGKMTPKPKESLPGKQGFWGKKGPKYKMQLTDNQHFRYLFQQSAKFPYIACNLLIINR